jgi:hypothetical protein
MQISRQIPSEASVVQQPNKVNYEIIGMGAEASTVVRAVAADFFFDCWYVEIPSDEGIRDIPRGVHYHAQGLRLEPF